MFLLSVIQYGIVMPAIILMTGAFLVVTGMRWWGGITLGHMLNEIGIIPPWCRNV